MDRFGISNSVKSNVWADAETDKQDVQDGVTVDYSGGYFTTSK